MSSKVDRPGGSFGTDVPAVALLRKLTQLSRAVAQAASLDEILQLAATQAATILDADQTLLMLVGDDGLAHVRASEGVDSGTTASLSGPLDEKLIERANRIGAILEQGLLGLMARHEIIGEVRGRGMVLGIDLVRDRQSRQPVPVQTTAKVIYRAYQLGAIFFYVGLGGNVLEFTPPLTLTEAEAAEGLAIIDQALTDVGNGMVSDAEVAPYIMW